MTYYIHWIDEKLEVEPNLKGSPMAIEASCPKEAWERFYALHPNLRDGEGDYYVMIRSGRVPKDDESDVLAEAGVTGSQPYFDEW